MATANNAELVKMSGPRDPYPWKFGVIEEGALADMILVDGNPLENIDWVADLSAYSQAKLNAVARKLNERPRKTLNYETPAERFHQSVASTG